MRIETLDAPTLDTLTEVHFPYKELVHGMMTTGSVYVLTGPVSSGKSNIARHLARSVASGQPFLGFRTHKSRVVFVNGELLTDNVAELDAKTPEGTELVVFDYPTVSINHGFSDNSLIGFAKRRNLAMFATSRVPGRGLTSDPEIEHWRLSLIDAEGYSYGHGRIEIGTGLAFSRAIPVVRGNDGEWTLDVHRVTNAFGNLDFHRAAGWVWRAGGLLSWPTKK
jgi:hypothetical protein